jgi:CBS domain-containing protein
MSLEEICRRDVVTLKKTSTLKEAARLMEQNHVGCVVITQDNGKNRVAGIITDRDLALSLGSAPDPQKMKIGDIMKSQPITAQKDDGIFEVTELMQEHGVKRIPVTNEDGSLFGIVSADDLLGLIAEEIRNLAQLAGTQIQKEKGELDRDKSQAWSNDSRPDARRDSVLRDQEAKE